MESVAPNQVTILVDIDAPHGTALGAGDPVRFPRINGIVLLPNETGALVGVVTSVGIERAPYPKRPGLRDFGLVDLPFPLRRMTVAPVGTLVRRQSGFGGAYELERGALSFPTVGDPVLLPTDEQLRVLVEAQVGRTRVWIGTSPLAAEARVFVDPDKLFGRHLAILGNTGSGKSCSVAGLIRWSLEAAGEYRTSEKRSSRPNARFVILDANGEYSETFKDLSGVRVLRAEVDENSDDGAHPLIVPAWLWNSTEWSAFTEATSATQRPVLQRALRDLRARRKVESDDAAELGRVAAGWKRVLDGIIAEGPTGFGSNWKARMRCGETLRNLAHDLSRYEGALEDVENELSLVVQRATEVADRRSYPRGENAEGFRAFTHSELRDVQAALEELLGQLPPVEPAGGPSEDAPVPFDPTDLDGHIEALCQLQEYSAVAQYLDTMRLRIRSLLTDTRLGPIVAPGAEVTFQEWLTSHLGEKEAGRVTVIDLSLVPADVLVLTVGVIARVLFEAVQRYRKVQEKVLPTVIVLEEAHTFIRRPHREEPTFPTPARMCREIFERIAREGRKFGMGLVLSSQRPSELSQTALAQCNTFLLHRIVNDQDQDLVGRLVPDNLAGLLRELPSLPSQQAVLLGWATQVPLVVHMRTLAEEHRPRSADPRFWDVWTGEEKREVDWGPVLADWVGQ